ncbi:uncharacterized protein C2orf81 homolog isoform X1 [Dendrobates tinctorius]|uniref:uncharacterized protein C2orf81 homolog isoform X1 n=2 Tax=Dendrobates tinctorius TaxID=92724 RepID=UPI003CCA2FEF
MSSKTGERGRGGGSTQVMPRVSVSKSRGDKSRTVTVAPLPPVTVDIIPGRFTEDDWMSMVTAEDGEHVVGDIVDSLISHVMEECLTVYLQQQVIPYTVSQARDAMLQIVQWTFVPRDEGNNKPDTESTWQEEPQPCPHDSWAQGCIPVTQPAQTPHFSQSQVSLKHAFTDIPEETPQTGEPPREEEDPPQSSQEQVPIPKIAAPPSSQPVIKPTPPTTAPKTRPFYRPHRGPLRSAGLKNITKSLEEMEKEMLLKQLDKKEIDETIDLLPTSLHNILKIQLGRPPQKKDVIYDHAGNVLSVPKVALCKLPQHHVHTQIEVLDIGTETKKSLISRKRREATVKRAHVSFSSSDPPTLHDNILATHPTTAIEDGQAPVSILLDTMPLTHGVILRKGDATERGSVYSLRQRELISKKDRRDLRPIQASIPLPGLAVEQVLKNNIPQVQPLISFMSH